MFDCWVVAGFVDLLRFLFVLLIFDAAFVAGICACWLRMGVVRWWVLGFVVILILILLDVEVLVWLWFACRWIVGGLIWCVLLC